MVHNEGKTIKYQFTKYVQVALERKRKAYLYKEYKRETKELFKEEQLNSIPILMEDSLKLQSLEREYQMPWDAKRIREYLLEQTGEEWKKYLSVLTDRELLILYAKVFSEFNFTEIGSIMGLDKKRIAASYAYARKKMRKERKKNGI